MEAKREGWARLGLHVKFPGSDGKDSYLESEHTAGSTLDFVSILSASFRATTLCKRPLHSSHEVASQSLPAPREKY